MSLSQSLQQKLLQKLSPQQIQLMKLLQVPTANLEERIKEELEENPALEVTEDHEDGLGEELKDEFDSKDEYEEADGSEDEYENIDISEYVSEHDDDVADYKLRDDNYPDADEDRVMPHRVETSFHEVLLDQLGMLVVDDRTRKIAEQIVGSIDDDGYLRRETASIADDLAFRQNIETSEEEIESLIKKIQNFDPPGVAARDLQECLLIQLRRKKNGNKSVDIAIEVLTYYFDEFTKKHYDKIQRGLNLDDEQLKEVINQIIKLNPKPGGDVSEGSRSESYVIPDFFIANNAGKLELSLNSKNAPDLRISEGYREMLKEYDRGSKKDRRQKEAVLFI
ncbi:MAG TPA: RNA polymerase sigma-54 factor, partial [Puia sp.]